MPNVAEPRAILPRTGLASVVTLIRNNVTVENSSNSTGNSTVPVDDVVHTPASTSASATSFPAGYSGSSSVVTKSSTNYRLVSGVIKTCIYTTTLTGDAAPTALGVSPNEGYVSASAWANTVSYAIVTNYIDKKLYTNGSTANADVAFVEGVINSLQSVTVAGGGACLLYTSDAADE